MAALLRGTGECGAKAGFPCFPLSSIPVRAALVYFDESANKGALSDSSLMLRARLTTRSTPATAHALREIRGSGLGSRLAATSAMAMAPR